MRGQWRHKPSGCVLDGVTFAAISPSARESRPRMLSRSADYWAHLGCRASTASPDGSPSRLPTRAGRRPSVKLETRRWRTGQIRKRLTPQSHPARAAAERPLPGSPTGARPRDHSPSTSSTHRWPWPMATCSSVRPRNAVFSRVSRACAAAPAHPRGSRRRRSRTSPSSRRPPAPGPVDVVRRLALAVVAPALEVAGETEREPARVVDDVRRRDLQKLDVVGGVDWPFRSFPQHSTSPDGRRPQEKALPAWTCTNFPEGGFVQPVSWSSPLRGQGRTASMAYAFSRRSPARQRARRRVRRTRDQHLTCPSFLNPQVWTRAARHLLIQPGRLKLLWIGAAPAHQFLI